jgi:hypothetical protein
MMAAVALGAAIAVPAWASPGTTAQERAGEGSEFRPAGEVGAQKADAAEGSASSSAAALAASNLTYNTVDPCRTFDSRATGGAFGYGAGYWLNLLDPCGLPADGSVKAVMANVISVNAVGSGYVRAAAYPAMTNSSATVLNFNNQMISSNAVPLPVCDFSVDVCDWDTEIWIPSASQSNVVIDILGYFSQ